MTATEQFAVAVDRGLIPVSFLALVDGNVELLTVSWAVSARMRPTLESSDRDVRARLLALLICLARDRVAGSPC